MYTVRPGANSGSGDAAAPPPIEPAKFYAGPAEILADPALSVQLKRRFLYHWADEIEARRLDMVAGDLAAQCDESSHYNACQEAIRVSLQQQGGQAGDRAVEASRPGLWRRLVEIVGA